jgi:hypothetical protein
MNNPDHISELKTIFRIKILKLFDVDPGSAGWKKFGSGMVKSRIRDKHPGSATLGANDNSCKVDSYKKE